MASAPAQTLGRTPSPLRQVKLAAPEVVVEPRRDGTMLLREGWGAKQVLKALLWLRRENLNRLHSATSKAIQNSRMRALFYVQVSRYRFQHAQSLSSADC